MERGRKEEAIELKGRKRTGRESGDRENGREMGKEKKRMEIWREAAREREIMGRKRTEKERG